VGSSSPDREHDCTEIESIDAFLRLTDANGIQDTIILTMIPSMIQRMMSVRLQSFGHMSNQISP
jgi:hypothetical protein